MQIIPHMKNIILYMATALLLIGCNNSEPAQTGTITVGVFDKNGNSPGCITDALEALALDPDIKAEEISAAQIASPELDRFDVIVFPGGSGRSESMSLGQQGRERIKRWVEKEGNGVVGICAGAYLLTNTPHYPGMALSGAKAIDIEHDHRGHGLAKFTLTDAGKEIFPELAHNDTLYCQYYEGPVLTDANDKISFTSLGTMQSDVHTVPGTPANMTNNKPFMLLSDAGKGKTASFVGHPETTPGMRWLVPRMVRVVSNFEIIAYDSTVVRPHLYQKELLFTQEQLQKQTNAYAKLSHGTPKVRIEGINELVAMHAWSAKKWVVGMVRDAHPEVRQAAANALLQLERTDAIEDLAAMIQREKEEQTKQQLQKVHGKLKAMRKGN
jgi:putative intracellular protease/amidase